jgi:serine/threonine protein kinase
MGFDPAEAAPTERLPDDVRMASALPDRRFGKFVLVRELGRGGFGAVHLAWQSDLNRYVALKFLHTDHPEDVQRFTREARMAAGLAHPNIVPIHEIGTHESRPYIAMAFVDGTTLAPPPSGSATPPAPSTTRTRAASSTATSSRRTS